MKSYKIIEGLTKEELISLLIEVRKINSSTKPANFKKSQLMKDLFKLEEETYGYFIDKLHNVKKSIESTILFRIETNNWN